MHHRTRSEARRSCGAVDSRAHRNARRRRDKQSRRNSARQRRLWFDWHLNPLSLLMAVHLAHSRNNYDNNNDDEDKVEDKKSQHTARRRATTNLVNDVRDRDDAHRTHRGVAVDDVESMRLGGGDLFDDLLERRVVVDDKRRRSDLWTPTTIDR